jgi:hypothetical protein
VSSPRGATVSYEFRRVRAKRSTGVDLASPPAAAAMMDVERPAVVPTARLRRVTQLLALAHRFADLLARGEVASMAELARVGRVTRARLSQIMDLTLLAPDIQEEILSLGPVDRGRDPVTMRALLTVAHLPAWPDQRRRWRALRDRASSDVEPGPVSPNAE